MSVTARAPRTVPVAAQRAGSGRGLGARTLVAGKYLSLVVAAVVTLLPLVVVFMTSFKTERERAGSGPLDPPHDWLNLHNYQVAFDQGKMLLAFANTAFILAFWS